MGFKGYAGGYLFAECIISFVLNNWNMKEAASGIYVFKYFKHKLLQIFEVESLLS